MFFFFFLLENKIHEWSCFCESRGGWPAVVVVVVVVVVVEIVKERGSNNKRTQERERGWAAWRDRGARLRGERVREASTNRRGQWETTPRKEEKRGRSPRVKVKLVVVPAARRRRGWGWGGGGGGEKERREKPLPLLWKSFNSTRHQGEGGGERNPVINW